MYDNEITFTCGICGFTEDGEEADMQEAWTPLVWVMDGEIEVKAIDEPICPKCSSVCTMPDDMDEEMTIQKVLYERLKGSYIKNPTINNKEKDNMNDKITFTCGICGMTKRDTAETLQETWTSEVSIVDKQGDSIKEVDTVCPVCSSACNWTGVEDDEATISEELFNRLKDSYKLDSTYNQKEVMKVMDDQESSDHPPVLIVKSGNGVATKELEILDETLGDIYDLMADC